MRIAAVGDVHLDDTVRGSMRPSFERIGDYADVLLLAGDLTRLGTLAEAKVVAEEFGGLPVPVVAVLGNHDYESDAAVDIASLLGEAGIRVIEGTSVTLPVAGLRLGVAGTKGFGGGFAGRCASAFGERIMKDFLQHTVDSAHELRQALSSLDADVRIALTHYAPVAETLHGEPPEIYPFLGSYLLGQAIDAAGADLAIHGHAHYGCERGATPGGVGVRNVAQPVIKTAFARYAVHHDDRPG